ncbi:DEAD/DEAH box helicase family protein [Sporosarcina sp. 179-K 3D1 HS]|uniref:DEAD/DEAH box helicase family protein n=1 Tax=Sporosarcina sp. 179-K 3D1 HS TaxID=3232169 RepID=UPI00399F14ED
MTDIRLITSNLIKEIKHLTKQADTLYWIAAFAMRSGFTLVLPHLKEAAARGAEIKILVGDYLFITQPEALRLLVDELPEAEIRLYISKGTAFHPKAYLFRMTDHSHVIVGSSNLSASAMTGGIEWNVHAPVSRNEQLFEQAAAEFMKQFISPDTIALNPETVTLYQTAYDKANRSHSISDAWESNEEIEMMFGPPNSQEYIGESPVPYTTEQQLLEPRPAQRLALDALNQTRKDGWDKAMAVLATGLGKTYLAAFFAADFKRVLFIAHREEILLQAQQSFRHVHPDRSSGIFNGFTKERDVDFVFDSVFTLASRYHLETFRPDEFDLIVIDEFHHAASPTYERILQYFLPDFLLGITATPHRMDNKDVYSLCDGNEAISIDFLDAIRHNWLSPFIYYGVYDEIDYSGLKWRNGYYDEKDLLRFQLRESYAEAVLGAWKEHRQTRTIGFCSSVKQATFLNNHFREAGYRTIVLHAQSDRSTRHRARKRLIDGELDVIFTVDLFNEGVDIPNVDTLLFARPTESLTVFTQQIGRGLRLADGKTHCVVIDLIGNYRKADLKLSVFSKTEELPNALTSAALDLPPSCEIHLDLQVIDLLEAMRRKRQPRKQILLDSYFQLKIELGHRPTYLDYHLKTATDTKAVRDEFGSYPGMLDYANEMNELEVAVFQKYQAWFKEVEHTSMTKSFKMVLLKFLLSRGADNWYESTTPTDAALFFQHYFTSKEYRLNKDISEKMNDIYITSNQKEIANHIAGTSMKYWDRPETGFTSFQNKIFTVHLNPSPAHREILYEWTKQICYYRLHAYFERNP